MSPPASRDTVLTGLENSRYCFGRANAARVLKQLTAAARRQYEDVPSLIRFHEALLVLRAFPPSPAVLRRSQQLLDTFYNRVEHLRESGADMELFDPLEVSGVAGTTMQDALGFDLARWLVGKMPAKVCFAWNDVEDERALGALLPRFMPLIEEDALAEANIPWQKWLEAAQGNRSKTPAWLLQHFASLPLAENEKAHLYDFLRLPIRWRLENSKLSRTRNTRRVPRVFFHDRPLITRPEVSLEQELARRPPRLEKLSPVAGEAIMDLIREVMLVRYRELYGTTLGDARSVVRADLGRGIRIFLWNLPPARRLPLRAYVAGLTLKNGVPINYIEAIGLFEWIEVGFNTFYTFRGGEVAWTFAQVLRCLCHLTGATCISMYPYQLGHHNEEAIASGAFWFYRKLGFRPGRPELFRLAQSEERRMAEHPEYRTPARTLRRLAEGHVFYELPGSEIGAWDRFSTRNLGLRVNRRMAADFGGNIEKFEKAAKARLLRLLGASLTGSQGPDSDRALYDFAMIAALIPDLSTWNANEKRSFLRSIRAKSESDEMRYLHLLQQHPRLRDTLLHLGSSSERA